MDNVEISFGKLGLGIMKVHYGANLECTDIYPVLKSRPADLRSLGPVYEVDGYQIGTGLRELKGQTRNVAWQADADEVARIRSEWAETIRENNRQVFFADEN